MPVRQLPTRPNLRQLRNQAKDLLRDVRAGDSAAVAEFHEFHPGSVEPGAARLADAQLVLARSYQLSSWPRLVTACGLIDAIWHDDVDLTREMLIANPELAREHEAAGGLGWHASMTAAANHGLRRIITRLMERGVRGVEAARTRPFGRDWLDTLRLLGGVGARPPADAVGGAVEVLQGEDFAFMVEVGADVGRNLSLAALALETYARHPAGKHRILEVLAAQGMELPDTAPMAVHRGRLDLLERHLRRESMLLTRTFSHREIYPPELACHADESLALHGAPLAGATLLHMAADYEDAEVATWLLDRGADVNVHAAVGADGFGGHTPLFNCVVTWNAGRTDEPLARLLLARGADPNARASIRKGLAFARDRSVHEYLDVTPWGWGRVFHDQSYVSQGAMRLIQAAGGHE